MRGFRKIRESWLQTLKRSEITSETPISSRLAGLWRKSEEKAGKPENYWLISAAIKEVNGP